MDAALVGAAPINMCGNRMMTVVIAANWIEFSVGATVLKWLKQSSAVGVLLDGQWPYLTQFNPRKAQPMHVSNTEAEEEKSSLDSNQPVSQVEVM